GRAVRRAPDPDLDPAQEDARLLRLIRASPRRCETIRIALAALLWNVQDSAGTSFRRHMRSSSCVLAFVWAAGILAARPAAACSCQVGPTPCQAFFSSPIVFVGE